MRLDYTVDRIHESKHRVIIVDMKNVKLFVLLLELPGAIRAD